MRQFNQSFHAQPSCLWSEQLGHEFVRRLPEVVARTTSKAWMATSGQAAGEEL